MKSLIVFSALAITVCVLVVAVGGMAYTAGYDAGVSKEKTAVAQFEGMNAVITANTAVYSEPLMSSQKLTVLPKGTSVNIVETMCDFYRVEYTNSQHVLSNGWILGSDISFNASLER